MSFAKCNCAHGRPSRRQRDLEMWGNDYYSSGSDRLHDVDPRPSADACTTYVEMDSNFQQKSRNLSASDIAK